VTEPILVEARRGGVVESVHRVHAVAVGERGIAAAAGDARLVTFLRSSAKPLQALPLVRARPDLADRLLAIACASHHANPDQLEAVDDLLAAAPATEDDLECGSQEGRPPGRRFHNCSGKHAGMLATCRARGWPTEGYHLPDHPLQRELAAEIAAAAELRPQDVPTATDGCGVVTFALPLARMARAFCRLEEVDGGARAAAAMRAHPQLVGGDPSLDTRLMRALPGWVAKGGAEGLLCARAADGTGIALKAEDGAQRALGPALAAFARLLGHELPEFATVPLTNSRDEVVGEVSVP
jgi:L-asparaginase II